MADDCYFFIDPNPKIPDEERTMSVLCVKCHDEDVPDTGWFYKGSKEGYGNFDYQCCHCGKFIHRANEEDEEEKIETPD